MHKTIKIIMQPFSSHYWRRRLEAFAYNAYARIRPWTIIITALFGLVIIYAALP